MTKFYDPQIEKARWFDGRVIDRVRSILFA
jgi:hypothetical protein